MHVAPTAIGGSGVGCYRGIQGEGVYRGGRVCLSHNNTKVSKINQESKFNLKKKQSLLIAFN
jgi:hypothetical protein